MSNLENLIKLAKATGYLDKDLIYDPEEDDCLFIYDDPDCLSSFEWNPLEYSDQLEEVIESLDPVLFSIQQAIVFSSPENKYICKIKIKHTDRTFQINGSNRLEVKYRAVCAVLEEVKHGE